MNTTEKVLYWSINEDITREERISSIIEATPEVLRTAVALGGAFVLLMANFGYSNAQEVWDDLVQYHDLRNS